MLTLEGDKKEYYRFKQSIASDGFFKSTKIFLVFYQILLSCRPLSSISYQ